jgi:hypothetical protein
MRFKYKPKKLNLNPGPKSRDEVQAQKGAFVSRAKKQFPSQVKASRYFLLRRVKNNLSKQECKKRFVPYTCPFETGFLQFPISWNTENSFSFIQEIVIFRT